MVQKRRVLDTHLGVPLSASFVPCDETFVKALLYTLHQAEPQRGWDIEMQDDSIRVWCDLHPTFGFQMRRMDLNKGFRNIGVKGQELVARIKANAC